MGEILGLGTTHYPSLTAPAERMLGFFHHILSAPNIDPKYKDRANWPREMLAELGNDEGRASIDRYRERMWANFRKQRKMIDAAGPRPMAGAKPATGPCASTATATAPSS